MRSISSLLPCLVLMLLGCAAPEGRQAEEGGHDSGAAASSALRATPEALAANRAADTLYQSRILGRWGDDATCTGWVWDFSERSLTGPGSLDAPNGITCSYVRAVGGAPDGAARIIASGCKRGIYVHGDIVMDAAPEGDTLTLTALYDIITPAQWRRCPE